MLRRKMTNRINFKRRGRKGRGFTLVELIVVLTILAILAAAGAFAAVGYIKRAKFNKNTQHAITVYQTAQMSIINKTSNGSLDEWTKELLSLKYRDRYSELINSLEQKLDQDNKSAHITVPLTYNPKSANNTEDEFLYRLLSEYFYDASVFSGTMAVEFDVSATLGSGKVNYSAVVVTSFYCSQNTSSSGWDEVCRNNSADNLPYRDYSYRRNTSFVGLCDGTNMTVTGPGGVSPVFLPQKANYDLEGHIIAGSTETGYLFNLRNGETLDVCWSIFDEDNVARDKHDENISIKLKNAETNSVLATLSITPDTLKDIGYDKLTSSTKYYQSFNNNRNFSVIRESVEGLVQVDVTLSNGTKRQLWFPITITRVLGDDRTGCPRPETGYYEYRLSLDCMMVRSDDAYIGNDNNKFKRYSSERLFGNTPVNLCATIEGSCKYWDKDGNPKTKTISETYAARAIDDPIYYTGVNKIDNRTTYCYMVILGTKNAMLDDNDIVEDNITGICVVNSLFGDKIYEGSTPETYKGGTDWAVNSDHPVPEAVITSFRHLYNIRMTSSGKADYKIVQNLDWYINNPGLAPVSEVKVFMSDASSNRTNAGYDNRRYQTPAIYGDSNIHIVSFPALNQLPAGQTLSSISTTGGKVYSINNVQLRYASFNKSKDLGYGLICTNNGTVYNITTNNLNIILADVKDGSLSDYSNDTNNSICPVDGSMDPNEVTINIGGQTLLNNNPVGGLIGRNKSVVGLADESVPLNKNSIVMNNCVVMAGQYWMMGAYDNGTGGIIGLSENKTSLYGSLETRGHFAILGRKHTGGIIGRCNDDNKNYNVQLSARLVVDGSTDARSEFSFPVESRTGEPMSCVVCSADMVGGAIGFCTATTFDYKDAIDHPYSVSEPDADGRIVFAELEDEYYQVDIDLPKDALILRAGDYDWPGVGGAIGNLKWAKGSYASIRVRNDGNIIGYSSNSAKSKTFYVGGAIGIDEESTMSNIYVDVVNGSNSLITYKTNGSLAANSVGGAYGFVVRPAGGTIAINVENFGSIISSGGDGQKGTGIGAGGAVGGTGVNGSTNNTAFIIRALNHEDSLIEHTYSTSYSWDNGVGGAFGGMNHNNNAYIPENTVIFAENFGTIKGCHEVGGAIGRGIKCYGDIYSINHSTCTITGIEDNVGGAVGRQYYDQFGTIQSILDGASITGRNFVGGACGRIQGVQDNIIVKTIIINDSEVIAGGSMAGGVAGDVYITGTNGGSGARLELSGNGSAPVLTVKSTGDSSECVGGVAGIIRANRANNLSVISPDQSTSNKIILHIDGVDSVGGAIGKIRATDSNTDDPSAISNNSGKGHVINVDVSVVLHPMSHICGTGSNTGGAIGYVGTGNGYGGKIEVKNIEGSAAEGASLISGVSCVGGAVGRYGSAYPNIVDSDSMIIVDLSSSPWIITGTVEENSDGCVGGAVGYFDGNTNRDSGVANSGYPIKVILGDTVVTSEGKYVGGAIGRNRVRGLAVSVSTSSDMHGADFVGGVIGFNESNVVLLSADITAGTISGRDYVGGAVGLTERNISNSNSSELSISVAVGESGSVIGRDYVAGALGRVGSEDYCTDMTIGSIIVSLNDDKAVQGASNIGGIIGELGSDKIVSEGKQINVSDLMIEINSGYPIYQTDEVDDAYIGCAIGRIVKGKIASITINGSGGTVDRADANSYLISRPVSNAILVSGCGRYIGGVIGKVGSETSNTSNLKLNYVSVDNLGLSVISEDNSPYIGGWIGACYAELGGTSTNDRRTYEAKIYDVYSASEYVGGFVGDFYRTPASSEDGNYFNMFANIKINLDNSLICGRALVGGAFGRFAGTKLTGRLDLILDNETRIGDLYGVIDGNNDKCICVDVGGAIGHYGVPKDQGTNAIISVVFNDPASMVFSGSNDYSGLSVDAKTAGVGGAVGSFKNYAYTSAVYGNKDCNTSYEAWMYALTSYPNVQVYSRNSNVGGLLGYMSGASIRGCFSTAVTRGDGEGCTGGFVGRFDKGYIRNCYTGGHTIGGQYIAGSENVIGNKYVGGFVGFIGSDVVGTEGVQGSYPGVTQCYSTSSVVGNQYVGGFVGYVDSDSEGMFSESYCTGRVWGYDETRPGEIQECEIGSFAGHVEAATDDEANKVFVLRNGGGNSTARCNLVVRAINGDLLLVGNREDEIFAENRLRRAWWNRPASQSVNGDTIRNEDDAHFNADPFDNTLGALFPLRTYVSVQINGIWWGTHHGDWPVVPSEDVILSSDVELLKDSYVYNGSAVVPELKVTYNTSSGTRVLVNGTDYTISCSNNDKVTDSAKVIIAGVGDYWGTVTLNYSITEADISTDSFDIVVSDKAPYNDGEPVIPEVHVKWIEGAELVSDKDYTLTYSDNIEAGSVASVTIKGIGNYKGEIVRQFTVSNVYPVTFVVNGGSEIEPVNVCEGDKLTKPADPFREGGEFVGWYTDPELTISYDFNTVVNETVTLYAKWNISTFRVVFDPNRGLSDDTSMVEVEYGSTVSEPSEEPEREGYTFTGWFTDDQNKFDFATAIKSDVTLYAGWIENPKVTLKYYYFDDDTVEVPYGSTMDRPEDPEYEGFTFIGWFSDEEMTQEFDFESTITENMTLYAGWIENPEVTLKYYFFDADKTIDVKYGSAMDEPEEPSKEGYRFDGWYLDQEYTTVFDFDTVITSDTTIYVKWVKTHEVTLYLWQESDSQWYSETLVVEEPTRITDTDYANPERERYVFDGWFTNPELTNTFDVAVDINGVDKLYARWKEE